MTIGIYGTLGAIWVLFIAACLTITPAGCRNRPPWWQRWRDRRQHERAVNALTVRLFHDIGEGLRREATGPLTSSGMPAYESMNAEQARARGWDEDAPLMPLPPGEYYDPYSDSGEPAAHLTPRQIARLRGQPEAQQDVEEGAGASPDAAEPLNGQGPSDGRSVSPLPLDPHDVATPGDGADYGDEDPDDSMLPGWDDWLETDEAVADAYAGPVVPSPEFGHLREGQYAEATGQFSRAVLDDYERSMAGGA
jgi:hypothetical protein